MRTAKPTWTLDVLLKNGLSFSFALYARDKPHVSRELAESSYYPDFVMFDTHGKYRVALNQSATAMARFRRLSGVNRRKLPGPSFADGVAGSAVRVWSTVCPAPIDIGVAKPKFKVNADSGRVDITNVSHMLRLNGVCHGEFRERADIIKDEDGSMVLPQCNAPNILTARGAKGDVTYLYPEMVAMMVAVV